LWAGIFLPWVPIGAAFWLMKRARLTKREERPTAPTADGL
jgi:hypothetical protein